MPNEEWRRPPWLPGLRPLILSAPICTQTTTTLTGHPILASARKWQHFEWPANLLAFSKHLAGAPFIPDCNPKFNPTLIHVTHRAMGYPVYHFQDGEGPCSGVPTPPEEATGADVPPVKPMRTFSQWVEGLGDYGLGAVSFTAAIIASAFPPQFCLCGSRCGWVGGVGWGGEHRGSARLACAAAYRAVTAC